ncbi:glycoside hydrolase family 92 protein [Armillaria gallica]|uniref:Glycoside hydrolase family 92 protein n=1 Tax=Armillaria gallica TaxID=47427 RepID=A0A2H3DKI1_ARMGA|nr:glycoside hydrolase family 92 protein [Armillaria gallica]
MKLLLLYSWLLAVAAALDPLQYVNLFTVNGGHSFPGATIPHGMVKVGMDTDSPGNLHQSGTGGVLPLSNFKLFPIHNCSAFEQCLTTIDSRKILRSVDDYASPGYFSNLSNSIRVELTSTQRTALHRYTFPEESTTPRIFLDVKNDGQISTNDITMLINPETGHMTASGSFADSFGVPRYNAYACVDFKADSRGLVEYGPYKINYPDLWGTDIQQHYCYAWGYEHGGLVGFPGSTTGPTTILARVGISLLSVEQTCTNAEEEIPDWDFERVVRDSEAQWRDILGRVQVNNNGVADNTTTLLYSSLYRTHITPADLTGENPGWSSSEPFYDSFNCNWDTYRTFFPFMSLHDPQRFADIVRGMIDIQKNQGWLPECREMGTKQFVQGGSHGDPILAKFFTKYQNHTSSLGVSDKDLYNALLADAENTPPNWNVQGRQADVWKELGYIPSDTTYCGGANTKQVSRAIEVAKGLNKVEDAVKLISHDKYAARARNFMNSWNGNVSVPDIEEDISGFFQNYTDPRHCSIHDPTGSTCFLNAIRRDGFYETSPIVYSQYVPHDTAKLIELQGGRKKFIERLDWMFDNGYFVSTNEPSQQIPHMYHYPDKPGYSVRRVRETINQYFNTSRNGLPGNDGAMGSYLPATKQYLLSLPYFPSISFHNPLLNSTTTIVSRGFGSGTYSVTVNGKPQKSTCFLDWDVFTTSSIVTLELTNDIEVNCGGELPPSFSFEDTTSDY